MVKSEYSDPEAGKGYEFNVGINKINGIRKIIKDNRDHGTRASLALAPFQNLNLCVPLIDSSFPRTTPSIPNQ